MKKTKNQEKKTPSSDMFRTMGEIFNPSKNAKTVEKIERKLKKQCQQ